MRRHQWFGAGQGQQRAPGRAPAAPRHSVTCGGKPSSTQSATCLVEVLHRQNLENVLIVRGNGTILGFDNQNRLHGLMIAAAEVDVALVQIALNGAQCINHLFRYPSCQRFWRRPQTLRTPASPALA